MDVFGLAALATIIRFIFWCVERVRKTLGEIARKRRTMRKGEVDPGEMDKAAPRD